MSNLDPAQDNSKPNTAVDPNGWTADLKRSKHGYYGSAHNIDLIVRNDKFFKDIYYFNDMSRTPELLEHGKLRQIEDRDIVDASVYLTRFWTNTIEYSIVKRAVLRECERKVYHPVKNYYDSLIWDGRERLPTWMHVYLGAEKSDYTSVIGTMLFIALVARIYRPGCPCQYVPVLEGPQGIGKSTAIRILGGDYYSDYMPDITSKDACIHVCRYHVIEISEMHTLSRADAAAQKQFITRTTEQYRPPHATMEVSYERQCVIIASINLSTYLKDETGGRRFWPVKCTTIDIEALRRDRDQLYAEAVTRFREGWNWWPPTEFETVHIKPVQEDRLEIDEWLGLLAGNVGSLKDKKKTTVVEIYQIGLAQGVNRLPSNNEAQKIGKMLRTAGCPAKRTKRGMTYDVSGIDT